MANALITKNKLHVSWSDSSFFPWLNETTVLDYFCDVRNPFYNVECNNQFAKMQNISLEQLSSMSGKEYQLYLSKPPLYVIRKVRRTSPKDVTPLSYYYVLHGVVYQAPDLMTVLSSRLQTATHYLSESLETAFSHYKYSPAKGFYWDFSQVDESKKVEESQQKITPFQRERVGLLLHEFFNRFPPTKTQEESEARNGAATAESVPTQEQQQSKAEQPSEKKKKV